jgi:S-DNA-T family DNA segregation ATPase FtsK/SpoIIIE
MSMGIILVFVSLIGMFQSGSIGKAFYDNLCLNITVFGTIIVLFTLFIIGLILFLDTSIDVFFLSIIKILKPVFKVLGGAFSKKGGKENREEEKKEVRYIEDKKPIEKPKSVPASVSVIHPISQSAPVSNVEKDFVIKPLAQVHLQLGCFPLESSCRFKTGRS